MSNYNDGLTAAPSTYNTAVKPYKRAESVYGGTKSMYNVAVPDSGRRTPGFDCSKSMYGGVEEGRVSATRVGPLKRSMSVHSKVRQ